MMRLILPILMSLPLSAHAQVPSVLTDIAPVHSLVAQVMDGVGTPDVLVTGAASPHDFQFDFNQADAVQNADLIIWVGAGLTPWLEDALTTLAPDAAQIALLETDGWPTLELRDEEDFEAFLEGDHDHDENAGRDPHAWLDPAVAGAWVSIIADALIIADPENGDLYRANAARTQADLVKLNADITAILADIPATPFLVPHDAYQYFGTAFDRPARAAISLSDATAPTPDQIAALQNVVATNDVACVLSDPQARSEWGELVAEGTDARTAIADPMGGAFDAGPNHYRDTMIALARAYADCLGG